MFLNFNHLLFKPEETTGEGAVPMGDTDQPTPNDLSFPTDADLIGDGIEIDDGDDLSMGNPDEGQRENEPEEMEHREELTEQQMLDELMKDDDNDSAEDSKENSDGDEFKIPDDFKDVLKRGDELHHVNYNEMKELAQKGYDYTQKTQELSNERKELEETFQTKEAELTKGYEGLQKEIQQNQKVLDEYNVMDYTFKIIEEKDPDLIEQVREHVIEAERVLNNPVNKHLKGQISSLEEKIQTLMEGNSNKDTSERNAYIAKTFETDLGNVKSSYQKVFDKVGLVPDWDKVKQAWIDGEANNMTVEQALFQIHGPSITKRYESKMKVRQTANKVGRSPSVSSRRGAVAKRPSGRTDWTAFTNDIENQLANGTLDF